MVHFHALRKTFQTLGVVAGINQRSAQALLGHSDPALSDDYTIKSLCEVLEVPRSGYYQWQSAGESARARQTLIIKSKITQVHAASRQTYDSPRVTAALRAGGQPEA